MMLPIRNSVKFATTILCFLFINVMQSNCVEFEPLWAKPANPYESLIFTSKGSRTIAIVGDYERIMLIDPDKGNVIFAKTVGAYIPRIDFVAIEEQNNKLYFGYKERDEGYRVDVYDTQNKLLLKRLSFKPDTILISDISPDNRYVVVIDNHYNVRVYNLESDSLVFNAQQEIDKYFSIYYAKFSNDGKRMALLGGTKIFIYDLENKKIEKEINVINYHVHRVIFSNTDKYLLRYNYGSSVEVFDVATGAKVKSFEHTTKPWGITLTDNGSLLISAAGNTVYFWDFNEGKVVDSLGGIFRFALLKLEDKEFLVVSSAAGKGDSISLWDMGTKLLFYKTIARRCYMNRFVAGGPYFISLIMMPNPTIYNTITGEKVKELVRGKYLYQYCGDTSLFYYYANDTIYLGDIFTGNINETYYYPISAIASSVRFSNKFKYLSYQGLDTAEYVVEWETRKPLYRINHIISFLYRGFDWMNLLFSPKDRYVAGFKGSSSLTERLLFLADGESGNVIYEHPVSVDTSFAFAFSYDEKYFFFRVGSNPVNQFDIEQRKIVKIFSEIELQGRTRSLQMQAFPDRPWLAVASDGNATVIDYDRNKVVARLFGDIYTPAPTSVSMWIDISSDGNYLLGEFLTDMVIMWKVPVYSSVEGWDKNNSNHAIFISQSGSQIQININLDKIEQIDFSVYDLFGRKVQSVAQKEYLPGFYSEILDLSHLLSGWYILVAQVGTEIKVFKISIVK